MVIGNNLSHKKKYLSCTFFEGSHLSLKTIIHFAYFWSRKIKNSKEIQFQLDVNEKTLSSETIVD